MKGFVKAFREGWEEGIILGTIYVGCGALFLRILEWILNKKKED